MTPMLPKDNLRNKRNTQKPVQNIVLKADGDTFDSAIFPSVGVYLNHQDIRTLASTFLNETTGLLTDIKGELQELCKLALENQWPLDYLLASQGGRGVPSDWYWLLYPSGG